MTTKRAAKKAAAPKKAKPLNIEGRIQRIEDEIEHLRAQLKPMGINIPSLTSIIAEEAPTSPPDDSPNRIVDIVK